MSKKDNSDNNIKKTQSIEDLLKMDGVGDSKFDEDEAQKELERLQKYSSIDAELKRAKKKHPHFPDDMFQQLAIMQEEAGEVTKAVLHYHYENGTLEHVREELIQTAAMCMRMLQNLPS
jgi:NTP pyrophosphatase (non-canonical NTP hydrolase)